MVGLSGGPGGAGPLFYVAHALAPTSTSTLAHWGEIVGAAVDSLATGTRGVVILFFGRISVDVLSSTVLPRTSSDFL